MKLEDIVVGLDLAKQLKEQGYPQETIFCWYNEAYMDGPFDEEYSFRWIVTTVESLGEDCSTEDFIAAPTASEIGEQLPGLIVKPNQEHLYFDSHKTQEGVWWILWKDTETINNAEKVFTDKNEANARARMWLYLEKEGLL